MTAEFKNWRDVAAALATTKKQRDEYFTGWNKSVAKLVEIETYVANYINANPKVADDPEIVIRHVLAILKGCP